MTKRKFEYKMRKANYYHEYGKKHDKPGFFPTMLGLLIQVLPKVGPLNDLKVIVPGPEAEKIFIQSFDTVLLHYTYAIKVLSSKKTSLTNIDFDTGNETTPGEYVLADKAYTDLLLKLMDGKFNKVSGNLQKNILQFYSGCNEKSAAIAGIETWWRMTLALDSLKHIRPTN